MKKIVVIYHRSDFDGIFCYQIAKKFLCENNVEDVVFVPWDYGDPVPEVSPDDDLYILDLSVDGLMNHKNLVWIDHHKSAIEKYPFTIPGIRIDGVAACRLAWQWFSEYRDRISGPSGRPFSKELFVNREVQEPLAVRLAGEYDVWDKRDPDAELFQHGLRSRDLNEDMWEMLLTPQNKNDEGQEDIGTITTFALLDAGEAIHYAKTQENKGIIESYGFTARFEDLTFLCCNHARFNSLLFTAGIKPEHDALMGFNYDGKGRWRVSLYHAPGKEHHDLSEIAKRWRGGGHKGACGFTVNSIDDLGLNI